MKRISPWKLLIFLSVAFSIFLLYSVLKKDYLTLPNNAISRGIPIGHYAVEKDFSDYYGHYYTATSDDHYLYLLISSTEGMLFKKLDAQLNVITEKKFPDYKGLAELQIHKTGDVFQIGRYQSRMGKLEFLTLDDHTLSLKLEETSNLKDVDAYVLTAHSFLYNSGHQLYLKNENGLHFIIETSYLSTLSMVPPLSTDVIYVSYTDYVDGQYQLNTLLLNTDGRIMKFYPHHYLFGAGGATKPSELKTYLFKDELHVLSVIKDQKSGINIAYWLKAPIHSLEKLQGSFFTSYTYSLSPQFYNSKDQIHLICASKTSIGKVEIGSDGHFQNLISIDPSLSNALALTKSTQPSLNPIWLSSNGQTYLFFNQVNQGLSNIFVASSEPKLIEKSQHITIMENVTLLMTSFTTFMPVMYVALIIEVYLLTPVLIVVVFISMFKLTWAERNGNKLLLTSLFIHTFTKFYFIKAHIFNSSDLMMNLPNYLNSSFKFLIWVGAMNIVSLLSLHLYRKEKPNKHYLYHYIFYNLVDLILFTMLYAPYYLLQ